jgi:hypothetical protein
MRRINRFKALEIPKDPTDYEDFEDIAPYNRLENGNWTSLCMDRHPLYYKITNRFRYEYDGKLMWRELNAMKEEIENKRKSLRDYQKDILPLYAELYHLIREQKNLCGERCAEKLQKHLDVCDGCTKDFIRYECQFKENGRCSHYYEKERATEKLEELEYYEYQDKSLIIDLEIRYERALAVKEDRLDEYYEDYD